MKKYLLAFFTILIFSSLAFGVATVATVGMSNTSGGGSGTNDIRAGETVYVSGTASNITTSYALSNVFNGDSSSTTLGELYITYWSQTPNSSYTGASYGPSATVNFLGNGANSTIFTCDFTIPSTGIPVNILYITIYFGLEENWRGSYNYSSVIESDVDITSAPTGYFTRLDYVVDTSTEALTLELPTANSTIPQNFTVQYDQPETAYAGSVKLTFTRTGGTVDTESPHVLVVDSETSGTDITLSINGGNLSGSNGVSLDTGGNTLVDDAIYTVKIEYQDFVQNTAASDLNAGITYDDDDLIEISGGDYNAGTGFSPGSTNNAFFRIQMNKTGSGLNPTVDKIKFDILGSFDYSDIDSIKIWSSTDNSFSTGDTQLVSEATNLDPFEPDFDPDESISVTVVYYFLTVDVSSTASGIDAIGAEIKLKSGITATTSIKGNFPITGSTYPLPVTLSSFTVQLQNQPSLSWITQSETNNAYWNVYRGISQNLGQSTHINSGVQIEGQGSTTEPTQYSYTDNFPIVENTTYWYWLECVDYSGEPNILGPISLFVPEGNGNNGTPATPDDYGLKQNYPNPFNPNTRIDFALNYDSKVQLIVYNIKGERIKNIFEGYVQADLLQTEYWDGKDENGKNVATGVYLYTLKTSKEEFHRRMLLMK